MACHGFASLIRGRRKEFSVNFVVLLETHVKGRSAKKIIKRLGFQDKFIEPARGHSGGIWYLWDPAVWKVEVLQSDSQYVHFKVLWQNPNHDIF